MFAKFSVFAKAALLLAIVSLFLTSCGLATSIEVTKSVTLVQNGNYVHFHHTALEPGMVLLVDANGYTYSLERDVINVEEKNGEVYGELASPMLLQHVSAVVLDYREKTCYQTSTFGFKSGEQITLHCFFPDAESVTAE